MKKLILSSLALIAFGATSYAQNDPFLWKLGDNTTVKLGGYLRFNINYDFDGSVGEANNFQPYKIPTETAWDAEDYLNFDPTATRFSLEIVQNSEHVGKVKAFVEADFCNTSNATRLRQAYVELCGITAGYAWSFMSDLASNAPTVDITGVNSRTFLRTMMVGYRHNFSEKLSGGIAIETPSLSTSYADGYTELNQTVPNIPAYIQLKGNSGHIKVAAAIRMLQYGEVSTQERTSDLGWGGQLSGSFIATKSIKLFGQAIYGEGINNYINDLSSQSINMMSCEGEAMEATPMGGASLGLSAKLSKKWTLSASGSLVENFGDEDFFDGSYKSSSYLSTALFFAPAPRVTVGAEYLNGSRTNFGGESIGAQRMSLSIKYLL